MGIQTWSFRLETTCTCGSRAAESENWKIVSLSQDLITQDEFSDAWVSKLSRPSQDFRPKCNDLCISGNSSLKIFQFFCHGFFEF